MKIFCAIAQNEGDLQRRASDPQCDWIWIDTACIDKTSSAELTEAINSMFCWYKQAHHCIAYLADVRPLSTGMDAVMDDFRRSEWFERGWTLQELLAPRCVIFMSRAWEVIGHKCSAGINERNCACCAESNNAVLNQELAEITGVPETVLWNYEDSKKLRPKAKWSWTAHRKTTKPEDTAYCLLGIFDVYMPLIYGEGARNASARLRQEIMKKNRTENQERRPGWQKGWSPFSSKSLFVPSKVNARLGLFPRQCQTEAESDDSDSESAGLDHNDMGGPTNLVQRTTAGRDFHHFNRAALGGLSPAQIAAGGDCLPMLDLNGLSSVTPAQIAAAEEFLPYWDSTALSGATPAQIKAAADAQRMNQRSRRIGVK